MTNKKTPTEKIEIDLDEDTHNSLIDMFVRMHLSAESQETFDDYISIGDSIEASLVCAVINEMVIDALQKMMDREANLEELKD